MDLSVLERADNVQNVSSGIFYALQIVPIFVTFAVVWFESLFLFFFLWIEEVILADEDNDPDDRMPFDGIYVNSILSSFSSPSPPLFAPSLGLGVDFPL